MLPYSIGSCCNPIPGNPALLNDVLSVPPVARLFVWLTPPTPQSVNSPNTPRSATAASGGPNTPAPRGRPVPESILKYASSLYHSGFGSSAVPKCCFTYASEPSSPSSSPDHNATRTVRRGFNCSASIKRAASIMMEQPIALSVAPVPPCQESRCPPSITISSAL